MYLPVLFLPAYGKAASPHYLEISSCLLDSLPSYGFSSEGGKDISSVFICFQSLCLAPWI